MGITLISSGSASGGSSPLTALTGSKTSETLPTDFAALLGDQLSTLQAERPPLTAQTPSTTQEATFANLLPPTGNKYAALSAEELKKDTDQALTPEQIAALAVLNPALSSQILPNLPQNPLPNSVDRNIFDQAPIATESDKGGRPLLSPITLTGNHKPEPTGDSAASFTAILSQAKPQTTGLPPPLSSAAITPEPPPTQLAETANIAAEFPVMLATSFSNALSAATAMPNLRETQAVAPNIPTPIHETRWAQDFGEKVIWLAKSDQQSALININPPQLGPMQISINLNGDLASAIFASPHAEVRQAIEDAMPRLREMLSATGISLGDANVGAQLPQQNRDNAPQFTQSNPNGGRLMDENAILGGDNKVSSHSATLPIQRGRGLVDLFA